LAFVTPDVAKHRPAGVNRLAERRHDARIVGHALKRFAHERRRAERQSNLQPIDDMGNQRQEAYSDSNRQVPQFTNA